MNSHGDGLNVTPIAIAVVEYQGNYLIGQRPADVVLAGLWEFPGGKVRRGESPAEAAVRECLEETGLAVIVRGPFPSHVHRYEYGTVELNFFDCTPADPSQKPLAPFRWVAREELSSFEFPAGNRGLLAYLAELQMPRSPGADASVRWPASSGPPHWRFCGKPV